MILSNRWTTPKQCRTVYAAEILSIVGEVRMCRDSVIWCNAVSFGEFNFIRIG